MCYAARTEQMHAWFPTYHLWLMFVGFFYQEKVQVYGAFICEKLKLGWGINRHVRVVKQQRRDDNCRALNAILATEQCLIDVFFALITKKGNTNHYHWLLCAKTRLRCMQHLNVGGLCS